MIPQVPPYILLTLLCFLVTLTPSLSQNVWTDQPVDEASITAESPVVFEETPGSPEAEAELPIVVPDEEPEIGENEIVIPEELVPSDVENPMMVPDEEPEIGEGETMIPEGLFPFPENDPASGPDSVEMELFPSDLENPGLVPEWSPNGASADFPDDLSDGALTYAESELGSDLLGETGIEEEAVSISVSSSNELTGTSGSYSYMLGGGPTGFGAVVPNVNPLSFLSGVTLIANLGTTYDSNITQATGNAGDPVSGGFIMNLGGTVSYRTKGREWIVGIQYTGNYELYPDNSDFNGYDQNASVFVKYEGAKLSATITAELARESGGNRFYGPSAFVEQTRAGLGLSSVYELGAKTLLTADANYNYTTATGGDFEDTSSINAGIAALWKYSVITQFGPGLRFTADLNGENNRTSIGPTLNLNYRLSSKVSLTSRVGLDFVDYSDGGSTDPSTSALLALNWNASRRWGMDLSVYRDTEADPFLSDSFNEITGIRVGYHRRIRRVNLELGVGYEIAETVGNGFRVAGPDRPDRGYLTMDASAEMMVFKGTTSARLFFKYIDQNGGSTESFDSILVGIGLTRTF